MTTPARDRFNEFYENGTPPWVIGEPQPAIVALEQAGLIQGKVLDAGCGLGEHTILLTRLGYDVLGIDYAPRGDRPGPRECGGQGGGRPVRGRRRDAARRRTGVRHDPRQRVVPHLRRRRRPRPLRREPAPALRPGGLLHVLALSDAGRGFGPQVSEAQIRDGVRRRLGARGARHHDLPRRRGPVHSEALGEPVGTRVDEPAWLARVRRR